ELVLQHVSVPPRPLAEVAPQVPVDLAEAVMRCLAKEPAARFADAGALRAALGGASYDDEALAYELADIKHLVAYALIAVTLALTLIAAAVIGRWSDSPIVGGLLGLPVGGVLLGFQIRQARSRGYGWDVIRRVATLPPRWWIYPWPAAWRRTGDVWTRLPRSLRAARWLALVMTLAFLLFIPIFAHTKRLIDMDVRSLVPAVHDTYAVRVLGTLPVVGDLVFLIVILFVIVVGNFGFSALGAITGRRLGLGALDWQRLATKPTDSPFWRDARIRPVLIDAAAPRVAEPSTPQELVTRILAVARTTTPSGAHTGADPAGAARRLLETITGVDRELESLARTAPPEQLERVEAELVLLEHDGADDDALGLLRAQRDALARAAERAASLATRRQGALSELEGLWRDVRRAADAADPREAAAQLHARAEAIERAYPPRTRSATRSTAASAIVALVALLAATPSTAAAPATAGQRAVAALLDRGALDSAARALDALAAAGDDSPARWRLAGRLALLEPTGRPITIIPAVLRALDAFGTAAAGDSSDVYALEHLVWLHRLAPATLGGRDAVRVRALARLERIAPYRAALLRAYLASVDESPGRALAGLRALVAAHPDSAPAWFGLADIAARESHADLARMAYARYRTLAPSDITTDFHVGMLAARSGVDLREGEASFRRYLARPWRTGLPRHDVAWWRLGQVLEKGGRLDEARQAYRRALAIDPKDDDFRASLEALEAATAR
ncbi:MAG: tetratricopeptide repeat protein, partial [Gemmatimonadaceae bacterium]|nr:tetratricopeptide repeat protein [Gemmatimonadaceae bacterium]MCU0627565.1 tetratricopeptide repeat protein [Gemmatimonadaceae bacterium]